VPDISSASRINIQEVTARAQTAHHIIIGFSRAMPTLADLWQQIENALSDISLMAAEVTRLHTCLASVRMHRANLAAAGRATVAAYRNRERDPLSYLRDELEAQGFGSQRGQP